MVPARFPPELLAETPPPRGIPRGLLKPGDHQISMPNAFAKAAQVELPRFDISSCTSWQLPYRHAA